jgi:hypothetical protein
MVVDYLDIKSVIVTPHKAYPPLIVHPNSVLAFPIVTQSFQSVAWGNA